MTSASTPTVSGARPPRRGRDLLGHALTVVRGVGQVDFMTNYWTGLLFIIALFVGGWQFGVFGLLGTAVATATARAFHAASDRIEAGLEGFCGTLIGVAFVLYLDVRWVTFVLVILGCVVGSVLTSAMNTILTPLNLPTFTAPFCVVTTIMVIGGPSFGRVWSGRAVTPPPSAATPGNEVSFDDLWHGMFNGIGQIYFQDKWYVGLIFLVGLFVGSRTAAVAAVAAGIIGVCVAWAFGAPAADISAGLYGYNAVLVAMALSGIFVALTRMGVLYAAVGAIAAAGLTAATTNFFKPVGGHTLTWPFVIVAWVFLAAVPALAELRRVEP